MATSARVEPAAMPTSARRRALAECARRTAASRSSFYLAFLPLPRERREGIFCVYAFCRRVDDIVDEPEPGSDPRAELEGWRRAVGRIVRGHVTADDEALVLGLAVTHERFGLREDDLLAVIDGMEMDLDRSRYESDADLELYCRRVAGHVGCLCLPVFGCRRTESRDHAMKLGHAFQLTNILRDVGRDARDGRFYLPQEHLRRFGVSEEDLARGRRTPQVRALMRHERACALRLFRDAESALPREDRPALFSASIMSAIYRRLLESMACTDHGPWSPRPSLPRRTKLLLALGVLLRDRALRLT